MSKKDKIRVYKNKAIKSGEWADIIISINGLDTSDVRNTNYEYCDNSCYWAKINKADIFYCDEDIFTTEKMDATHIVVFLK